LPTSLVLSSRMLVFGDNRYILNRDISALPLICIATCLM
jgi:hypothetical protein